MKFGHSKLTFIHREEFPRLDAAQSGASSSFAGPEHRRTALVLETSLYGWDLDVGLIASGSNKIGEHYTTTREAPETNSYLNSGYSVLDGTIEWKDNLWGRHLAHRLHWSRWCPCTSRLQRAGRGRWCRPQNSSYWLVAQAIRCRQQHVCRTWVYLRTRKPANCPEFPRSEATRGPPSNRRGSLL